MVVGAGASAPSRPPDRPRPSRPRAARVPARVRAARQPRRDPAAPRRRPARASPASAWLRGAGGSRASAVRGVVGGRFHDGRRHRFRLDGDGRRRRNLGRRDHRRVHRGGLVAGHRRLVRRGDRGQAGGRALVEVGGGRHLAVGQRADGVGGGGRPARGRSAPAAPPALCGVSMMSPLGFTSTVRTRRGPTSAGDTASGASVSISWPSGRITRETWGVTARQVRHLLVAGDEPLFLLGGHALDLVEHRLAVHRLVDRVALLGHDLPGRGRRADDLRLAEAGDHAVLQQPPDAAPATRIATAAAAPNSASLRRPDEPPASAAACGGRTPSSMRPGSASSNS